MQIVIDNYYLGNMNGIVGKHNRGRMMEQLVLVAVKVGKNALEYLEHDINITKVQ